MIYITVYKQMIDITVCKQLINITSFVPTND